MSLREILSQLPYDYPVVIRSKYGTSETPDVTDLAGYLVEDDGKVIRLEDFELVSEIHLPELAPADGPVDLKALMSGQPPEDEWMVEPILPAGKLVGFVSRRGEGKSLFILDVAAAKAAGYPILLQKPCEPMHVVYIDLEMGPNDLYDRLHSLGWTIDNPDFGTLADHLHYYQLVTMPPLDTQAGGEHLEALVKEHDASLVVVDTVSRVISGEENKTEPFRDLFRHTETRLKRRGVTLARLDHLGKDLEKGSRGSSAKEDPLDVVWHITNTFEDTINLKLTKGRQDWVPRHVSIRRETVNGVLSHRIPEEFAPDWLIDLVGLIDSLELPVNAGYPTVSKALQDMGEGRKATAVRQAIRFRKARELPRFTMVPKLVPPRDHLSETTSRTTLDQLTENTPLPGVIDGTTHGTTPDQSKGRVSPPRRGTTPDQSLLPDPF